jgi:hypothetical protein
MALRTSVEVEGGRPVVRQVADGVDVDRLRRRAAGLAAAAGPGVVAIVRAGATADGAWELVTVHAGLPLSAARLKGAVSLAAVGARVAEALARLHAVGLVHGRLQVEHVLVGPDGAPELCGIEPSDGAASDDVAALGRILGEVASDLASDARLATLGARAAEDDPERRPTARRLAADLAAIAAPEPAPRAAPRAAMTIVAVLGVGLAALILLSVRGGAPAPEAGVVASTVTTSPPTTSSTLPECVASAGRPVARSEACPERVTVDGGAVEVGGRRLVVGRPSDEVLVGDWACEGVRAAVLRPATGEVLVYEAVGSDEPPEVARAERIEGATGLGARRGADGCPALLVLTPTGPMRLT